MVDQATCWVNSWAVSAHSDWTDGLVQDCSNSIANALELLQSYTKPLKWSL